MARQIAASIERSLPSDVSWVGLGKVTLGPTPPKVRCTKLLELWNSSVLDLDRVGVLQIEPSVRT